jgi:hypothetical protein
MSIIKSPSASGLGEAQLKPSFKPARKDPLTRRREFSHPKTTTVLLRNSRREIIILIIVIANRTIEARRRK